MRKIAISYRRFSSKPQELGTSLDRQEGDAQSYCDKVGWKLDSTLIDPGASAFHGKHLKDGELGRFVAAVEKHPEQYKGKILLVEDLSRLSRLGINKTHTLVSRILGAGVDIATINPEFYLTEDDLNDLPKVMQLVVYADMYYKQSLDKSRYSKKAWQSKWKTAHVTKVSAKGPTWLKLVDGEWEEVPEKANVVRRLFTMTIDGMGVEAICRQLTKEGVPALGTARKGKAPSWQKGYVLKILTGRTVLGEYTAGARSKQDVAPQVIKGYYHAILDESTWDKAQSAIRARAHKHHGPQPHAVNPLQGLCKDKASGSTMFTTSKPQRNGSTQKQLVPSAAIQGQAKYWSVPLQYVLDAVILGVQELKVVDGSKVKADPMDALQAKLEGLEANIQATIEAVAEKPIPSILALLRKLEGDKEMVVEQIASLKAERANKLDDSRAIIKSAWLALKECETEEHRQALLASIRGKLRGVLDRVELTKKEQTVAGTIFYKQGQRQKFQINLEAIKTGKGHEIVIQSAT